LSRSSQRGPSSIPNASRSELDVTIWEYIAQPEHPWFDTSVYTPFQMTIFTIGALLWVVVYLITIHSLVRFKELDIPIVAVTLNFGCEITTAFFFVPDMGLALVLAYWAWLVLDLFIVIGLFRYGRKQVANPYLRSHLPSLLTVWMPLVFVIQYFFILRYDVPMAPLNSFMINLVMSAAFIFLVFVPGKSTNSPIIGWCKFLGTGIIGVMFYTKYPDNDVLTSLYVGCALLDVYYIYLLYNVKPGIQRAFASG